MIRKRWILISIVSIVTIALLALAFLAYLYKTNPEALKSKIKNNKKIYALAKRAQDYWRDFRDPIKEVKERSSEKEPEYVSISVDAENVVGALKPFWSGVGDDLFYNHYSSENSRMFYDYLSRIKKSQPVVRLWRSHNIFSDREAPWGLQSGGKVYSEKPDGTPVYNWERVDKVYDLIVSAGLTPIVELGFMPEELTSDENRNGDWGAANVAPPKDYQKWKALVSEAVQHLVERYGEQTLNWYFEVWNEPDLYYFFWVESDRKPNESKIEEYNKLYDYTVQGVLEVNPNLKVGGPAIAGWGNILKAFLKHVESGKNYATGGIGSPIDFLSFHRYGFIDEHILRGAKALIDEALAINEKRFSSLPILIDEYGPTTESRDDWRNTPYVSSWVAATVCGFCWLGDRFGEVYFPDGMVFWSGIGKNFEEGQGIVASTLETDQGLILLRGPVLNVFDLLNFLGTRRLKISGREFGHAVYGLATINDASEIAVMIYRLGSENPVPSNSVSVSVNIDHIRTGDYTIRQFRIDQDHSNPYGILQQRENLGDLTDQDIREMKEMNRLQPYNQEKKIKIAKNYTIKVNLPVNSVHLLMLIPKN